jgi:beta-lactamase regulating signal transducer with metallopeptidase domain/DUF4097 and DUF4098 domain-containing protein YvlB
VSAHDLLGSLAAPDTLSLLLKVTLLLGIAIVVSALLRNRSAALRHFVWLLALAASLALPLLARAPQPIAVATPYWPGRASSAVAGPRSVNVVSTTARIVTPQNGIAQVGGTSGPAHRASAFPWLPVIWLAGVLLVLAWQALGTLGLRRLSRQSVQLADSRWHWILGACARQAGVNRPVELRTNQAVGSPLLHGIARPTIVLPSEAEAWPEETCRAVALHELAHVARHDPLTQRIAALACALYWFHPGVWLAARRLRAESERACDDRVLGLGFPAADYAAQLVEVMKISRMLRLSGAVAIGMANRSTLEGRLLALFEGRKRGALTRRVRLVSLMTFALILCALVSIRPVGRAAASAPPLAAVDSEPLASNRSDDSDDEEGTPYHGNFDVAPGGTLVLRLDAGAGIIVRGWDQRRVQIEGRTSGPDGKRVAVEMKNEGNRVSLIVRPKDPNQEQFASSNHFEIHVPRRFDIDLDSSGGELTAENIEGTLQGSTGGGDLRLSHLQGSARLETGGGQIEVTDSELSGAVSTGGGRVRIVRVKGGLKGSSGGGPVTYSESGAAGESGSLDGSTGSPGEGMLQVAQAGGDIQLDSAPNGARVTTGGGEVEIGSSGGKVEASTGGGNMHFGSVSGSLQATTGGGDVEVTLSGRDESRTVDVQSGGGVIVLRVPEDLGLRLELETAYTKQKPAARIVSDFPLELEPTTGWDDHEGTARKYVRATGRVGSGRIHVRLKTVNADLEIRRR